MTRLSRTLPAMLDLIVLGGPLVALCCIFGVGANTVGYWLLMGWSVLAVIVLVMDVTLPLWAKAGPLSQPRVTQKARVRPGAPVTMPSEH